MIRLGHVYRGQMVDMRATNAKLRRRAIRMLSRPSPRHRPIKRPLPSNPPAAPSNPPSSSSAA